MIVNQILDSLEALQHLPSKIFLVGLPCCGKTKNGKALAAKLNYAFIDTDHLIEEAEGKTITDIFSQLGESHFRNLEQKYLRSLAPYQNYIISTGGGLPCYHQNMQWINENGTSIWLNCPTAVVVSRLVEKSEHRPMTRGKSKEEIELIVEKLAAQRFETYKQATLII